MNHLAEQLRRLIEPLASRVKGMIVGGWVRSVDDSTALQRVTVSLPGGDVATAERFQNYGFTSVPMAPDPDTSGAQAVLAAVGSRREQLVAIAVDDGRFRPIGLQPGDVAQYDSRGSIAHMGAGGVFRLNGAGTLILECGPSRIVLTPDTLSLENGPSRIVLTPTGITIETPALDIKKV